jgi:hypothetical protein
MIAPLTSRRFNAGAMRLTVPPRTLAAASSSGSGKDHFTGKAGVDHDHPRRSRSSRISFSFRRDQSASIRLLLDDCRTRAKNLDLYGEFAKVSRWHRKTKPNISDSPTFVIPVLTIASLFRIVQIRPDPAFSGRPT